MKIPLNVLQWNAQSSNLYVYNHSTTPREHEKKYASCHTVRELNDTGQCIRGKIIMKPRKSNEYEVQCYLTSAGIKLSQCMWSNPEEYE